MPNFLILGLPRSRTAWLAYFLGANHDAGIMAGSTEDFLQAVDVGTVETGAHLAFPLVRARRPEAKVVLVRRPLREVLKSMSALGLSGPEIESELKDRDETLDRIAQYPGVKSIEFKDLNEPFNCSWLYEYLTGKPLEPNWWAQASNLNVQVTMSKRLELLQRRSDEIARVKAEALEIPWPELPDAKEVTLQLEPFTDLWPEIGQLAKTHFEEVATVDEGKRPFKLHTLAMDMANKLGQMPMFTARVDGYLVGYLTWNVFPDLECADLKIAQQGGWYVKEGYEKLGLGWKLMRYSLGELKKAGIDEVFMHHRLNGRAKDLTPFFKRLRATEIQHTYYLKLKD